MPIDDLYSKNPGSAQTAAPANIEAASATAGQATTAPGATAGKATSSNAGASNYDALTQSVGDKADASKQLNTITSQDSPLMQRARQEGLLTAAKRGLQNSSIAAGASEGAMVDRATPLAQQNAQQEFQQGLNNQNATNQSREFNAGIDTNVSLANAAEANKASGLNAQLDTSVSQGNAEQANDVAKLNAQLETAVSQGNTEQANAIRQQIAQLQTQTSISNTEQDNAMRQSVLQQNADLNKQFLAGTQALDLATIQGQYQQLISSNELAGSLYNSYFSSIAQAMANKDIAPDRIAQYVRVQQAMLESGLRMMDQMNAADLSGFQLPNVTSSGTGKNSDIGATLPPAPTTPGTGTGSTTLPVKPPVVPPISPPIKIPRIVGRGQLTG